MHSPGIRPWQSADSTVPLPGHAPAALLQQMLSRQLLGPRANELTDSIPLLVTKALRTGSPTENGQLQLAHYDSQETQNLYQHKQMKYICLTVQSLYHHPSTRDCQIYRQETPLPLEVPFDTLI